MDCNKTVDFVREYKRMCQFYRKDLAEGCCRHKECPLAEAGVHGLCISYIKSITQKHIDIVQKWSDEHPNPFMWDCNYNPTNDPGKAMYIFVRDEETKKWLMELFAEKNVSSYITNNSVGKFLAIKNGFVKLDADVEIENVNKKQEDLKEARRRRNLINYAYKRIFGKEFSNGRLW